MPSRRRHRPVSTTAGSVALALCAAAALTGCGNAKDAASPAAAVREASATAQAPSPSTSSPPAATTSASPQKTSPSSPILAPSPPANAAPQSGGTPPKGETGTGGGARTAAVTPQGVQKLPAHKSLGWKADGPLASQNLNGQRIEVNECATVTGATLWQQQGYLSSDKNSAGQQLFGFPTAAAAKSALDRLLADMKGCQAATRKLQASEKVTQDAVVTATATTQNAAAWSRRWTGVGGIATGAPDTEHLFAVQQGDHLTLFQFGERSDRPTAPYDTGDDPAMLAALTDLDPKH
ncbi:hypothetical protein [Streptomyces sp. NPDC048272]|uniref:sensor domain-containing protein n=1 Tax=Streptomyces sp. NPDC048272 TaxID=3154616 RepID=UPI00343A5312